MTPTRWKESERKLNERTNHPHSFHAAHGKYIFTEHKAHTHAIAQQQQPHTNVDILCFMVF